MTPLEALVDQLAEHHHALALGSGHSVVSAALRDRGVRIDAVQGDWPSVQLPVRYSLVIVEPSDASRHVAAIVHCAAQHVGPDGGVVVFGEGHEDAADRFDLTEQRRIAVEGAQITVLRRTERVTIHDKVFEARSRIARITPLELADRLASESARPSSIPARQPIGLVSG